MRTLAQRLNREVTWPDWHKAAPGTRVAHNVSGATGTFVKPSPCKNNGAIIDWDDRGFGVHRGHCISPPFDLHTIS